MYHEPRGSDGSCSAPVHNPMTPIAEPRPPSCTPSLAHSPSPSSREDVCLYIQPPNHSTRERESFITHERPAHIARGGHLHRPAHARERRRRRGVPFADDVDRWATWPCCGCTRVVRDTDRQWDYSHYFVQRWVGESLGERLRLFFFPRLRGWSEK